MGAVIMNLGQSARKNVVQALDQLLGIKLPDPPAVQIQAVGEARAVSFGENFVAFVSLLHEGTRGTGFVLVQIPKTATKKLFLKTKLKDASEAEFSRFSSEFCVFVAEAVRQDMQKLGIEALEISPPKAFKEMVDTKIQGVRVNSKYVISIYIRDDQLLTVEVAFKSQK